MVPRASRIVATFLFLVAIAPLPRGLAEEVEAESRSFWVEAESLDAPFLAEARAARDSIPAPLWTLFNEYGWTVRLSPSVVEAAPFLRGVHPRGWPAGTTWENADAVHLPQYRLVIVASHRRNAKGERVAAHRVSGVLRHELGHAIDVAMGESGYRLSDSPRFRRCYERDLRRLKTSKENPLAYYARGGSGPTETFAELLADHYGGGSDANRARSLRVTFSATRRLLISLLPPRDGDLRTASKSATELNSE